MVVHVKPSRLFSDEMLTVYRQQGDAPADAVITSIVDAEGAAGLPKLMRWLADTENVSTTDQLPTVRHFFEQYSQLPDWADWTRMKRSMDLFRKNGRQIGLLLGCYSLPYCYLGAHGAQVLWLTERIKQDTTRRLQETGEWIFAVNNPKEWTTGKAISRTLKVRLIHAGVRWYTLRSSRWNDTWGHPVNQEDMAGTNLAFSYIVLRGLRKLDISLSQQQEEDYLHHSNVIGYLNGVSEELLPKNLREAYHLDRSISRRQFATSDAGIGLTNALLNAMAAGIPAQGSPTDKGADKNRRESVRNLAAGEMRFFLGDQYANWLGIPQVPLEKRVVNILNHLPIFSNSVYA
ncbi:hypothetical protein GCM10028807_23260 [Spirosoma daeguense]